MPLAAISIDLQTYYELTQQLAGMAPVFLARFGKVKGQAMVDNISALNASLVDAADPTDLKAVLVAINAPPVAAAAPSTNTASTTTTTSK
jgi:hypothetical protein